jgi:hypothetical protein
VAARPRLDRRLPGGSALLVVFHEQFTEDAPAWSPFLVYITPDGVMYEPDDVAITDLKVGNIVWWMPVEPLLASLPDPNEEG